MRAEPERLAFMFLFIPPLSSKCSAFVNCAKLRRSPPLRYGPTGDFGAYPYRQLRFLLRPEVVQEQGGNFHLKGARP
jgi:hypothetical protein